MVNNAVMKECQDLILLKKECRGLVLLKELGQGRSHKIINNN